MVKVNALPFLVDEQLVDVYVLQDAASMYLSGNVFSPCEGGLPPLAETRALFKRAWDMQHQWPERLLLPESLVHLTTFATTAKRSKVPVQVLPDGVFAVYVTDVQAAFHEHFAASTGAA